MTDTTGAVIPGATVVLVNSNTGETVRTVKADSKGTYSVPLLQVGTYTVTGSMDGFNEARADGIQLHISDSLNVNLTLSVRTSTANVTVTAEAQMAPELESAAQTSVITGTAMKELALNTRNFEQMIQLTPGVVYGGDSDQSYTGMVSPSGTSNNAGLSLDGLRATQNAYMLDGTDMLSHGANNQVSLFPTIDSIQELKVVRDSYGAEYGGGGSAQVQIITKSGAAEFHGDLYVFARNAIFNANDFFTKHDGLPRPEDDAYDGGASIGGPVYIPKYLTKLRDNTFFFASTQFTRDSVGVVDNVANEPSQAEIHGSFPDPVCITLNAAGTACATGGSTTVITTIDPEAQAYIKDILQYLPEPNGGVGGTTTPQALLLAQLGQHNEDQILFRLDHSFNERFSMFFRYLHDPIFIASPYAAGRNNGYPGVSNSNIPTVGDGYMMHATYALTSTTVLDAAISFQPYSIHTFPVGLMTKANSPDVTPTLPFVSTLASVPNITLNNGTALNSTGPQRDDNRTYQGFANVFHNFGQHSVSVGVNYEHIWEDVNQGTTNAGTFSFSSTGQPCTGNVCGFEQSFANFLLGRFDTFVQSTIDAYAFTRANLYEAYIEDDWKILPRLTLNLGVRYSYYQVPTDSRGHLASFDPRYYNPALAPTIQGGTTPPKSGGTSGMICAALPCSGGVMPNPLYSQSFFNGVIQGGIDSPYGNTVTVQPKTNFAPRVGFAWDVYGNGQTSLRGGFGVFYNQVPLGIIQTAVYNNPYYDRTLTFSSGTFSNPGGGANALIIPPNVNGVSSNWKSPYTMAYSLGIEQYLPLDILLDVRYVGNGTRHLFGQIDINQPLPLEYITAGIIPSNAVTSKNTPLLNQIRPYLGYTVVNSEVPGFTGNYNSLQVEANKKLSHNSRISLNYTWGRSMSDSQGDTGSAPQNSYNPKGEYGRAAFDRRQVFTGHFVYTLPFYADERGFKGHLLGGFEFSGIVTAASGLPLTAVTNTANDPAGQGVLAGGAVEAVRPNQIADPNAGPRIAKNHMAVPLVWFNEAADYATAPNGGMPGNEQIGAVNGPGYQVWNIDMYKNIAINERSHLQLRVEAFNVWNHTNWTGVQLQLNNNQAGDVISDRDPRKMQFGAKYIF